MPLGDTTPPITLRRVMPADDDFLLAVYASTRADELARVPWTQEQKDAFVGMQFTAQKRHYADEYPQASHDIILADERAVGRIYLDRAGDSFHILDVTVLPEYRSRGIGSSVLRGFIDEAGANGKAVTIYIESFNPSLRLFQRLGFQTIEEDGFQLLLKKLP